MQTADLLLTRCIQKGLLEFHETIPCNPFWLWLTWAGPLPVPCG